MSLICPTIRSLAVQNIRGCSVPSSVFCCMIAGYNDMILTSRRIVCEGTCLITCFLVLVVLYAVALQCNNIRSLYACTRQRCRVFAYLLLLLKCIATETDVCSIPLCACASLKRHWMGIIFSIFNFARVLPSELKSVKILCSQHIICSVYNTSVWIFGREKIWRARKCAKWRGEYF